MGTEPQVRDVGVRVLKSGDVGSYKTGCFYSETIFGIPDEYGLVIPSVGLVGERRLGEDPVKGGPDITMRIMTLLHEAEHFVQDLSLGSAVARDLLLDQALGVAVELIRVMQQQGKVRLPLDTHEMSEWGRHQFQLLKDLNGAAVELMDRAVQFEFPQSGKVFLVSGAVLMEGAAAASSARALRARCGRSDEARDYLADIQDVIPILPVDLGEPYSTSLEVFTQIMGWPEATQRGSWPRFDHSLGSIDLMAGSADIATSFLADIACQVPPHEVSAARVNSGRNDWSDFIPSHRWARAVLAVERAGGLPEMPATNDNNDWYRLLFDLIADQYDWPSYTETSQTWLYWMRELKQTRRGAVDGFRYRLLYERYLRPADFILKEPLHHCWGQMIPLIHSTPTGLKVLQGLQFDNTFCLFPFEMSAMPALEVLQLRVQPWKDLPLRASVEEGFAHHNDVAMPLFFHEVVSRTIGRTLQEAIYGGDRFSCPYARTGCQAAIDECSSLVDLTHMPTRGCAVRYWFGLQRLKVDGLVWAN